MLGIITFFRPRVSSEAGRQNEFDKIVKRFSLQRLTINHLKCRWRRSPLPLNSPTAPFTISIVSTHHRSQRFLNRHYQFQRSCRSSRCPIIDRPTLSRFLWGKMLGWNRFLLCRTTGRLPSILSGLKWFKSDASINAISNEFITSITYVLPHPLQRWT